MKSSVAPVASAARVLLIDDNRNGLLARKALLEEAGYATTAFSDPEEGVAAFGIDSYDLVITDYRMPRMNGKEVIAAMRAIKATVPVVLISGVVDALGLNEQNTGADVVVSKNNTEVSHLLRAVSRLLRRTTKKPNGSQNGRRGPNAQSL